MQQTGAVLETLGCDVAYLWREDMLRRVTHGGFRRLLLPWAIALRCAREGHRWDVVEIHEPLGAVYGLARRFLLPRRLPPLALLSHGLEARGWAAVRDRARQTGHRVPLKSRITVPVTLISQAVLAAKTADVVIVLSSEDAEYLTGRLHVPSRRVIIAPSGVDSRFLATTKVVREDDEIRLIFVGSWIDRKGTPELGAAWEALGDDPRLRLTLAGTSAGVVEVLASLPRIYRDRVVVVPVLDQDAMCELLAAHDLFVLPSWFEGMPITLLEAAATGLPCVACSICGNRDVFPEEQAEDFGAIMIPPHRSDALIEALAILIADPARRDELGRRARRRASLFSWEASAEQIASAYSIACGTEVPSSK